MRTFYPGEIESFRLRENSREMEIFRSGSIKITVLRNYLYNTLSSRCTNLNFPYFQIQKLQRIIEQLVFLTSLDDLTFRDNNDR